MTSLKRTWSQIRWNTVYSPPNHSASDVLWDATDHSHGSIAMDCEWATRKQWPITMYLPSDHSKGVDLLRAYHQLHCLVSVRAPSIRILINAMNRVIGKTFWEAVERRAYTWSPSAHTDHCFDAPRQLGPPFQITDRRCRWVPVCDMQRRQCPAIYIRR